MRIRFRWMLAITVAVIVAMTGSARWKARLFTLMPVDNSAIKSEETRAQITYVVDNTAWTAFELPANCSSLRILTNATLRHEQLNSIATGKSKNEFEYGLKYRFVDSAGEEVIQGEYHFRTRIPAYRKRETGRVFSSANYDDLRFVPASMRKMLYSLDRLPRPASRLLLRLNQVNSPATDIGVRVYFRHNREHDDLDVAWQRLSQFRQERLARASIYCPSLLTLAEKRNLLTSKWSALAPAGVEGVDYVQRSIHTLMEVDGEEIREDGSLAGLVVASGMNGTIPLPEQDGMLRLQVVSTDRMLANELHAVTVHYFRQRPFRHDHESIELTHREVDFEMPANGGVLDIESEQQVVVRAYWKSGDDETEITPNGAGFANYVIDDSHPVEFAIHHVNAQETPFRISLSSLELQQSTVGEIEWTALNSSDQVVASGVYQFPIAPSLYDRYRPKNQVLAVSEPDECYFRFPAEVCALRIRSNAKPILVGASNRPNDLVKETRVPKNYSDFGRAKRHHRTWYHLRARNHLEFKNNERIRLVRRQVRPPQRDPTILAGTYEWDDFHPTGDWIGRFALVPTKPQSAFRPQAAASTFCEITSQSGQNETKQTKREHKVRFVCPPTKSYITPKLIFQANQPLGKVEVFIDDEQHFVRNTVSVSGLFELPPVTTLRGRHSLRVQTPSNIRSRMFVNCIEPNGHPVFHRRLLNRFHNKSQTIDYVKVTTDETLLITVFRQSDNQQRLRVKVTLRNHVKSQIGPHDGLTLTEGIFDLAPSQLKPAIVLGTSHDSIDGGEACFMPFGSDLPAGQYEIELQPLTPVNGYIMLSRTNAGSFENRAIYIERRLPALGVNE